jgi:WD40 repeat protein
MLLLFAAGFLHAEKVASGKGPVLSVAWSSGGMILAADQTVKPLDGDEAKPRVSLEGYTGDVYSIAWSPNGKILATGSDDQTVKLWDAATGRLLADLPGHTDAICSVAWSPNGRTLASSAGDATLKLWDELTTLDDARSLAWAMSPIRRSSWGVARLRFLFWNEPGQKRAAS